MIVITGTQPELFTAVGRALSNVENHVLPQGRADAAQRRPHVRCDRSKFGRTRTFAST